MNIRADIPAAPADPGKRIVRQRDIINRRELAEEIEALIAEHGMPKAREKILPLLQDALASGRAEISRRLVKKPSAGHEMAAAQSFLVDQLVRLIHEVRRPVDLDGDLTGGVQRVSLADHDVCRARAGCELG